ncbi:MAG TPA: cyclic nucleotide-binding domain-containing protein, partial [Aggregatilineales bacterium]|nr:cyclic nucleotide-binding domain-containing protein [Aggregatilineales bacterium]
MADDALGEMAQLAKMNTYPPDTVLCHEGAEEQVFYIIGEGQVSVTQQLGDEERFLRYSGPGQYFGEMALIANSPRNANVRTTVETTVLEIDKETFVEMIRQNPIIALTMFQTSVGWLRSNDTAAIAALIRQKDEIERAYAALQLQEKRRSEFLTSLAHELRTPLTTVSGFMQLIRRGTLTGSALEMGHERISAGLDRIVSLVNDLLFVQEMELIEPALRAVNLPDVVTTLIEELDERAEAQSLEIITEFPDTLPYVEADPDGLLRALRALLDNAIKFSPGGGTIEIGVSLPGDSVDIAFHDPGIGIEPEFLPRIFERFEHQERRGEYLFEGMGLGLAIARHLIESFGGS